MNGQEACRQLDSAIQGGTTPTQAILNLFYTVGYSPMNPETYTEAKEKASPTPTTV